MVLNGKKCTQIWWRLHKNYEVDSNKEYILEVDVEYPKDLHNLHSDLSFLSKRMKTKNCYKLVCNIYNKEHYVVHVRALKEH